MNEEEMKVRTSMVAKGHKLGERLDSFNTNTHLVGKAGPPDDNDYPGFVQDWDVSVLRGPHDGQRGIM